MDINAIAKRNGIHFSPEADDELSAAEKRRVVCDMLAHSAADSGLPDERRAQARTDLATLDHTGADKRIAAAAANNPN
jgi:hypothetical protein